MKGAILLGSLALVFSFLRGSAANPGGPTVSFSQLDIEFDGDRHQHSEWGSATLEFTGSDQVLYFNLASHSGDSPTPLWRIQNLPVLSREGPDLRQTATFDFNLGNTPGKKVHTLDYAFALTSAPLTEMPQGLASAMVDRQRYVIDTGLNGDPIVFVAPPDSLVGGAGDGEKCTHKGFPNQKAKADECVPAAASNSLQWLNEKYALKIPAADISIDALKPATGWDPKLPGCDDNWPDKKKKYLEEKKIPVTTDTIDRLRVDKILEAICRQCDVEVCIGNHTAAVTGAQKLADGNFKFDLTHDSEQDNNKTGGTITEEVTYDDVEGRFHGSPWLENKAPELIVVECPVKSNSTPTPSPAPTNTPTPSTTPR